MKNRFVSLFSLALVVGLLASATHVKAQQPTWSPTGSLGTGRFIASATLLTNGQVLVTVVNSNTLPQAIRAQAEPWWSRWPPVGAAGEIDVQAVFPRW